MLRWVSGWILLLISFNSLALTQTRLLQLSSSGQTVVFDAGVHERLTVGEFGIILKQIADIEDPHSLRVVPVAKVRSVKIGTDHSVWVMFQTFQSELLKKGDLFTLFSESNMIPGRREYETSTLKVVSPEADIKKAGRASLRDDADLLAKSPNYEKDFTNYELDHKGDEDFELIELEKWLKHKNVRYRTGLYRSQNRQQFKRALRLEVFEGLVTRYLQRVNDPDFNYGSFYDEQMKDSSGIIRKRSSFPTAWENYIANRNDLAENNARLSRTFMEKGERWSEDYSDEELGNILTNMSVIQEKERRAKVISKPARFHLAVDYGQIISDHQTEEDTEYNKSNRYEVNLDFEVLPILKHEIWERFTINGQISMKDDAIGVGAKNFDRADESFTLGVNWYPFYAPYTISAINLYLGTYFRAGQTKLRSDIYEEKANYTLFSIPGFRVGLRYTFKNKVSLRLIGSVETVGLERTGSNRYFSDLPETITKTDMNLALGLGYSF